MTGIGEIPSSFVAATMAGLETKPDRRGCVVRDLYATTASSLTPDVDGQACQGST
jgi:hypothetical protein